MAVRGSTYLFCGVIVVLGVTLFQIKYTVADFENTHQRLKRAICAKNEEIHVLNAEWAYLTGSARLQELARKHLPKLNPIKGDQVVPYSQIRNSGLGEQDNSDGYDRQALDRLVDKAQKEMAPGVGRKNKKRIS